jgi:predicted Zn-dependent protease
MQLEARLLRAEILLQQGREREALALLDSMYLPELPRGRELQTVRGELRIKYGRCTEGRPDLDEVLAKDRTDGLARRAARAISLCP